jgi:hypothetical protein
VSAAPRLISAPLWDMLQLVQSSAARPAGEYFSGVAFSGI